MADTASHAVNGNHYGSYNGSEQQFTSGNSYANNNGYGQAPQASSTTSASQPPTDIPKDEVGWYFVEQYYTTLSRTPEKLYLYYNKRSQYVSGNETDKVQVCVGQRAINDRIKELDFQDCKVRITNVDSQASDSNIVIQVIGEISNKSQPHRKFTQTFVLASQTNGYFVLNDIFRFIIEEEEEGEAAEPASQAEEVQQAPAAESRTQEPAPTAEDTEPKTLTSSDEPAEVEADAKAVDKELEEKVLKTEPQSEEAPVAAVNGTSTAEEAKEEEKVEETPASPAVEEPAKVEEPEAEPAPVEEEKPKDPEPSPVASPPKQAPAQPAAPPKPAVPKTWASLAASAHKTAAPANPAAPVVQAQPKVVAPKASPAPSAPASAPPAAETSTPAPAAAAQRDASPAANSGDEWTAVPSSHNRQQSRQVNGAQTDNTPNSRGYIKNVGEKIEETDLRTALEKFGAITSFDIARSRNCAFVDFKTPEAYKAAVAANPLNVSGEKLYVEERRMRQPGQQGYVQRGQYQGGRGGGRGNFRGGERGGFNPRGGRGGARGGRGDAQGA